MKNKMISVPVVIFLILMITMLSACTAPDNGSSDPPTGNTITQTNDVKIRPYNVVQIGDSFKHYPNKADGHLLCTVTGARIVTDQADCPALNWFDVKYEALISKDGKQFYYDEWFTDDGAYVHNCRIVVVDLTVTNVDAQSWLDNGSFTSDCGWFYDPYVFYANHIGYLADLTKVIYGIDNKQYITINSFGFSRLREYSDNIPETKGYEPVAIRLLPGETISFSLAFPIHASNYERNDGTLRDMSTIMLCNSGVADTEKAVFIDLNLEDK